MTQPLLPADFMKRVLDREQLDPVLQPQPEVGSGELPAEKEDEHSEFLGAAV